MAKAIEAGVPKLRIEEASGQDPGADRRRTQAVIGVNKFKPVNEAADRRAQGGQLHRARLQIDKLKRLRRARPEGRRCTRWRR
jgi:methylmalonyl-CoA mutase